MGDEDLPDYDERQPERLKRLREALGYETQTAFAERLGISLGRWNNFENGKPLSHEIVTKLLRLVPGLTSDWLYYGRTGGLPVETARWLGEFPSGTGKRTTDS